MTGAGSHPLTMNGERRSMAPRTANDSMAAATSARGTGRAVGPGAWSVNCHLPDAEASLRRGGRTSVQFRSLATRTACSAALSATKSCARRRVSEDKTGLPALFGHPAASRLPPIP